jgi:phage shock protein A
MTTIDEAKAILRAYREEYGIRTQRTSVAAAIDTLLAHTADYDAATAGLANAVTRILDQESAWIAQPNPEVARRISFAALVALQAQSPPSAAALLTDQLYDVTQQRDAHFAEIERARGIIADLRADYDALKGRLEEAVRLLDSAADNLRANGYREQAREIAAFLDREKEAGRG